MLCVLCAVCAVCVLCVVCALCSVGCMCVGCVMSMCGVCCEEEGRGMKRNEYEKCDAKQEKENGLGWKPNTHLGCGEQHAMST